jgi:hypothetical protein
MKNNLLKTRGCVFGLYAYFIFVNDFKHVIVSFRNITNFFQLNFFS